MEYYYHELNLHVHIIHLRFYFIESSQDSSARTGTRYVTYKKTGQHHMVHIIVNSRLHL